MTLSFAPERIETWPLERLKTYGPRGAQLQRLFEAARPKQ